MRISDWSSDVCSSDLRDQAPTRPNNRHGRRAVPALAESRSWSSVPRGQATGRDTTDSIVIVVIVVEHALEAPLLTDDDHDGLRIRPEHTLLLPAGDGLLHLVHQATFALAKLPDALATLLTDTEDANAPRPRFRPEKRRV